MSDDINLYNINHYDNNQDHDYNNHDNIYQDNINYKNNMTVISFNVIQLIMITINTFKLVGS